ncbi:hypothetical protein L0Z72_10205 [candidate division KSB1 bacterium]|nr:hypothetical protein [candidate division KSB1 bacterium]
MKTISVQISEEELKGVIQAYQILQSFLEKIASANELYQKDFLEGLNEALADVKSGRFEEVNSFEAFIQ